MTSNKLKRMGNSQRRKLQFLWKMLRRPKPLVEHMRNIIISVGECQRNKGMQLERNVKPTPQKSRNEIERRETEKGGKTIYKDRMAIMGFET